MSIYLREMTIFMFDTTVDDDLCPVVEYLAVTQTQRGLRERCFREGTFSSNEANKSLRGGMLT